MAHASRDIRQYCHFIVAADPTMMARNARIEPIASAENPEMP
ncbi:MAG: hypothetical protein ACXWAC_01170 [Usitatibacter sp.]